MKSVEVSGKTVDEAIAEALDLLETTREMVEITVLEEGTKGFLGIGSRQAKVLVAEKVMEPEKTEEEVAVHEVKLEAGIKFLTELLAQMDVPATVEGTSDEESVELQINGDNLGLLIGRKGQTLESLQYITSLAVNRQGGQWMRINLDIGDYRSKREESLRMLAQKAAAKVEANGRRIALDPMSAAERRIVHQELQEFSGVLTQSEGQDPYRRVIILPK